MHVVIKRWLYVREAFRRFGFEPEELHFRYQDAAAFAQHNAIDPLPAGHVVICLLETQGKEFVATIGLIEAAEASGDDIQRWFDEAVFEWNSGRVHNVVDWQEHMPLGEMLSLGMALEENGIVVPNFIARSLVPS